MSELWAELNGNFSVPYEIDSVIGEFFYMFGGMFFCRYYPIVCSCSIVIISMNCLMCV